MKTSLRQALIECGFISALPMATPPYPSTPEQARTWFTLNGICITEWCNAFKLDHGSVTDLLRGKSKGTRGESHKAAVKLGLKKDPNQKPKAA